MTHRPDPAGAAVADSRLGTKGRWLSSGAGRRYRRSLRRSRSRRRRRPGRSGRPAIRSSWWRRHRCRPHPMGSSRRRRRWWSSTRRWSSSSRLRLSSWSTGADRRRAEDGQGQDQGEACGQGHDRPHSGTGPVGGDGWVDHDGVPSWMIRREDSPVRSADLLLWVLCGERRGVPARSPRRRLGRRGGRTGRRRLTTGDRRKPAS